MDESASAIAQCRNCQAILAPGGGYCPSCGQKVAAARLTLHDISHDLIHALFHVDHSVLSLFRVLLLYPGRVALDYVEGKRKRYFGPFALLVVVVALATAAIHLSGAQKLVLVPNAPETTAAVVQAFLIRHANVVFFLQVPLLALASRALGGRGRFNYAEYLVLAAYTSSVRILFFTLAIVPLRHTLADAPATVLNLYAVYLTIWALYFGVASAQFMGKQPLWSAVKGAVAVILAQVFASLILSAVAQLLLQLHVSPGLAAPPHP